VKPAFEYPTCPTCKRRVERLVVEHNRATGSYLITTSCHGKNRLLRLTEDDMAGYQPGPLVKLELEKDTANSGDANTTTVERVGR
jgi:hypothetical protein